MSIRVTLDERFDGVLVECAGVIDDDEWREGMDALSMLPAHEIVRPLLLDFGACSCTPLSASKHALSVTLLRAISTPVAARGPLAVVLPPCGHLPGYNPARVRALSGEREGPELFERFDDAVRWIASKCPPRTHYADGATGRAASG